MDCIPLPLMVAKQLMIQLYLYQLLLLFITRDVHSVSLTKNSLSKNNNDGSATIPQYRIFDIGLHRKTLDLAKHAKLALEQLSETKRLNNNIINKSVKNNINQKIKIVRDLTNQIIERSKNEFSLELDVKRKLQVLKKAIINFNFIVQANHNKSSGNSKFDSKISEHFGARHSKVRDERSILENSPVLRILYNLDSLKDDLERWQGWIDKSSSKWNNEQRTTFTSAVHLMISALYQYKRITYQIMFDKNLLSLLALYGPVPRNDFFFNHNRVISFTKVGTTILIKINDKEYQSEPHEFRIGGLVTLNNGLTKDSISNFTKVLQMTQEQEDSVIGFVNENIVKSIFHWSLWGHWSGCSVTCGMNGVKVRQRVCVVINLHSTLPSCSGGDTERVLCSATQACQKKSEILCWVEGFGFLNETAMCDCTFVPHLCMNGGECQKRPLTNGRVNSIPHHVLACQCAYGFSGPVCEYAWFTTRNILTVGVIGVVMLISFILSCCFCVQGFRNYKSEKWNISKTSRESQSTNAGNFGDEDFSANEVKDFMMHSKRDSEHLKSSPGRIESNQLFNTSLLVNPARSLEKLYIDKMKFYAEPKNTNANTSTSQNPVEPYLRNNDNGDSDENYDNVNNDDDSDNDHNKGNGESYDNDDNFLSKTANMSFQQNTSSSKRSPISETTKICQNSTKTSSTSQKSKQTNPSEEEETNTWQNESNLSQSPSETSSSDVGTSKIQRQICNHSRDRNVIKGNLEAYRIFKNNFLNYSIRRGSNLLRRNEMKAERSRSPRMKIHFPIKSKDQIHPIFQKSLRKINHNKMKKYTVHKRAKDKIKDRGGTFCPNCNPHCARNFSKCCRNCRNYDNKHTDRKRKSKVEKGKIASLEHIVGLPINPSHQIKSNLCQHSICRGLQYRLMFNKDIVNSTNEDNKVKVIYKVGVENETSKTQLTKGKIKAFKAIGRLAKGNYCFPNIQQRLIFS